MSKYTKNQNEAVETATTPPRADSVDDTSNAEVKAVDVAAAEQDSEVPIPRAETAQLSGSQEDDSDEDDSDEAFEPGVYGLPQMCFAPVDPPALGKRRPDAKICDRYPHLCSEDYINNPSLADAGDHLDGHEVNDGKLRVAPLDAHYYELFEQVFDIDPTILDVAHIEMVHFDLNDDSYHHFQGAWAQDDSRVFHGQGFNRDFAWNLAYISEHLPAVPFGHSLRAPIFSRTGEVIDYRYYRLAENRDRFLIQAYEVGFQVPRVSFLPDNRHLLEDPTVPLVLVDDVFQALQAHRMGHATLNLNGMLHRGFFNGESSLRTSTVEAQRWSWSESEGQALVELLHLHDIPLSAPNETRVFSDQGRLARTVAVFCDTSWLLRGRMRQTLRLAQQTKSLFEFLQQNGAQPYLVTANAGGPGHLASALSGVEWDFAHIGYMQHVGFGVSH